MKALYNTDLWEVIEPTREDYPKEHLDDQMMNRVSNIERYVGLVNGVRVLLTRQRLKNVEYRCYYGDDLEPVWGAKQLELSKLFGALEQKEILEKNVLDKTNREHLGI